MAKTAAHGFSTFLSWLSPSQTERSKASLHRESIYNKLDSRFGLYRMFQSGSFKHGTGVAGYSDVDFIASLKSNQTTYGSSTLNALRDALKERFPSTYIHVAKPAVVCEFGSGYERVEVIPAFPKGKIGDHMRFAVPGVTEEWMFSTPEAHLTYVNGCNASPKGGAKGLARMAKAWKYYRNVPISSFYLEMRAAAYMKSEVAIVYAIDVHKFLKELQSHGLADMNDPTGSSGRIKACSSQANKTDALSKLDTAVTRAKHAWDAEGDGNSAEAFRQWDLLFAGHFPAYG